MPCEHFTEAWQQAQVWDSSPALQGGTQLESTLLPLYRARQWNTVITLSSPTPTVKEAG